MTTPQVLVEKCHRQKKQHQKHPARPPRFGWPIQSWCFLHRRVQACTFSPADDIIHVGRHSRPEAVVSWVTRLRADDGLRVLVAFVKPPELAVAEQVGFSVVGPDEGRLHSVHQGTAFLLHAPIRERSRVALHGHRVLKDPIFRPLKNRGTCEGDIYFLTKKKTTMYFSSLDTLQPGTFQLNLHYSSVFCLSFFFLLKQICSLHCWIFIFLQLS